jgi:TetR/AcrR family transcriptional regulator, mexJK operon transcriptional repressor
MTRGDESAPTGKRAERSRQAIVAAAREVFLSDGYEAGIDAIAAAAGVSKVTVYNHFGSKEGLFIAVIGQALDEALGATLADAQANLADTEDIRAALTRTARSLVDGVSQPPVLAMRNLVTGELRRFPELGDAWRRRGPGQISEVIGKVFGDLHERGWLVMPDLEVAVIQFFALTLYPCLIANSYGATLGRDLNDRLLTSGVDMFLHRYQPLRNRDAKDRA